MYTTTGLLPTVVAVAIGGGLGATSRLLLSGWMMKWLGDGFAWGTLFVNAAGALCVGFVYAVIQQKTLGESIWVPLLMVGYLGGLTTFSTFSLEVLLMLEYGAWLKALVYVLSSVFLCILLAWAGLSAGAKLFS